MPTPRPRQKRATIRRDATGLDARLAQALLDGAAGASLVSILDIEPHTPKYASPSRLYTKLRFTIEVTGGRQYAVDVDTYGALETWYGLSINSSSNETVYVEKGADDFTITFRRWGHGVGMSQRGAQTMAQRGMSFRDILAFYYPGTQLRTLSLSDTTGSGLHNGGAAETPLGQLVCIGGANVYAEASTAAACVGSVPAGALVDVHEAGPEWSRIAYGSVRGWAQSALFALPGDASPSPSPSATPAPTDAAGKKAVVTMAYEDGRLYLRSGPSTDTAPVTTVRHGDTVTAYETAGEWTRVETATGRQGYLKSKYLVFLAEPTLLPITPAPTATPTASPSPDPSAWATPSPSPTSVPTATPSPTPAPTPSPTPTPQPTVPPLEPRPYGSFARVTLSNASSRLNLRASASTASAIVDKLRDGDYVEILADKGGWARVETVQGKVGYVQTHYLRRLEGIVVLPTTTATPAPTATATPTATPGAPSQGASYARVSLSSASSRLNLRSSPSTSSAIVATLDHGKIVRVLAASGSWVRVETASGQTGYVQSRYLAPIDGAVTTPAPTATAAPTATPRRMRTFRRTATTPACACPRPPRGSTCARPPPHRPPSSPNSAMAKLFRVLAASGSWVRVETASGQTGYVQSRYLEPIDGAVTTPAPTATAAPTATPAPDTGEMTEMDGEVYADIYVSASGGSLHVRQGPSTQTPSVTTVSHGSWVQVLAVGGEWARVRTRLGNEGYLKVKYLVPRGDSAAPTQSDMIACDLRATAAQSTPARTRPAADAAVVATIPAGTPLYVKAYDDDWAHVFSVSGASSGYVLKAHLRLV